MRPFRQKSRMQRLLDSVRDIDLPDVRPSRAVKTGLLAAAGGLTALTAGSAGISSLRHRGEEAEDSG